MSWTEERVALLRKLWGEGKTAAEIAHALGNVTRNAVIGKAHRLKLSNRISPIQQNTKKTIVRANDSKQQTRSKRPVIREEDIKIEGRSLAELKDKMCRWPIGDPKDDDFMFCGCLAVSGLPYCPDHSRLAYQAASRSRMLQAEDIDGTSYATTDTDEDSKEAVA